MSFLASDGVLDADYEVAAAADPGFEAVLRPDRTPTSLAGRILVIIDSSQPLQPQAEDKFLKKLSLRQADAPEMLKRFRLGFARGDASPTTGQVGGVQQVKAFVQVIVQIGLCHQIGCHIVIGHQRSRGTRFFPVPACNIAAAEP